MEPPIHTEYLRSGGAMICKTVTVTVRQGRGRGPEPLAGRGSGAGGGAAHLDLHGAGGQRGDLLLHAVGDAWVHGGAARHDVVGVQVLPDVDVALHDAVVGGLVDARRLHSWGPRGGA